MPAGTVPWMAPEFIEDRNIAFTEKQEVYSYGVLMWEVFCARALNNKDFSNKLILQEPYSCLQPVQVMYQVTTAGLRPELPQISENQPNVVQMIQVYRLMQCCWQ